MSAKAAGPSGLAKVRLLQDFGQKVGIRGAMSPLL